VARLLAAGHQCYVFDQNPDYVAAQARAGAEPLGSVNELAERMQPPRVIWLMIPATSVDAAVAQLSGLLGAGDIVVDGGNSDYRNAIRRAEQLGDIGVHFVDVGTSGGVWGKEFGYCLMIGGDEAVVERLEPIFSALAPGLEEPQAARGGTASRGFLHCGPSGAGHFVKMIHNGIEYGLMQAYAEGFNVLKHAGIGRVDRSGDAETAPLDPNLHIEYEFDLAAIAEVWRHSSVIRSWLLDLITAALTDDAKLDGFAGRVSDSGEGRWAARVALEQGVPTPALAAALFARFESQGAGTFADRLLSAMRDQFGGHAEKTSGPEK